MKTYLVGGAVRDALLQLPVTDRDWTVVGGSPEELVEQGFRVVGRDFPVFIHPKTGEEYALARTERKTAPGYAGFSFHAAPSVTLEEDLARRDLTINAMAQGDDGVIVDPYGGRQDLADKLLRHVSPAFAEDPVRILRLARLAARFADFRVADGTLALARKMVDSGEVDSLVAERVWQELSRGLMEARPSRMFEVLRDCGALARLMPEVDRLWGVPQRADYHPEVDTGVHLLMVLDMSAQLAASLPVRFACLGHDLGKGTTPTDVLPRHIGHEQRSVALVRTLSERLRVPVDCRELAEVVAREHGNIHRSAEFGPAALVRLLERCDSIRRPERFADALLACECDARGRLGLEDAPYPQRQRLMRVLELARSVDTAAVASEAAARQAVGPMIAEAIHAARVAKVAADLDGEGATGAGSAPT
ncbi:multifunctional CCA addition/repair protein [soil metagenome]